MEDLDKMFRRNILKVGIRASNLPSREESEILYAHVIKNYGNHTIAEFDLAFEMAITGKLELSPKEVNPFENFSCVYVSRIINAYRFWSGQAFQNVVTQIEPQIPRLNFNWRGVIEQGYQDFLCNQRNIHRTFPVEYYEQLVADNFIYPFLYKELMDQCRQELCHEVQLKIIATKKPQAEDEYDATRDLERKIIQYRSLARETEVVLLAKQKCVLMLFSKARSMKIPHIYIQENSD